MTVTEKISFPVDVVYEPGAQPDDMSHSPGRGPLLKHQFQCNSGSGLDRCSFHSRTLYTASEFALFYFIS